MDFLPGQVAFTQIGGNVYDGQGRASGFLPAGTAVQIAGAKKSIVTPSAWFWAYPATLRGAERNFVWIPEGDLAAEADARTFTGAMSDVTLPGYLFPPLGIYQALSGGGSPSSHGGSVAERPAPEGGGLRVPWSAIASLAVVAGGALAVYFIYMASQKAIPIQRRAGRVAGKLLSARYGQMAPERRSYVREPSVEFLPKTLPRRAALLPARDEHPLLGAYDAYAPE